jgi:hypothetical protein
MVIGLKEAIEEFLERQGMSQRQVFKTTNFFIGVLEDIERQWPDSSADKWIDISDKGLPEKTGRYLLYFPERSTSPMDGIFDLQDKTFTVDGIDRTDYVTHWQPLLNPHVKQ